SLKLIMARLSAGAEGSISMSFLVMCAEKVLRLLCLFFVFLFAWLWSLLELNSMEGGACNGPSPKWDDLPVTA
ncbi:hypothetical protein KBY93_11840, partial [Synechococcus sp. J7-Johnson]|uniref:hypothetical protein n=1 Tax=Synechococcus sp. J7-Johnson TaxID=2823737 RepID=UPI0020CF19D4